MCVGVRSARMLCVWGEGCSDVMFVGMKGAGDDVMSVCVFGERGGMQSAP